MVVLGTGTRVPDSLPVTRVQGTRIRTGCFYYPFAVHSTVPFGSEFGAVYNVAYLTAKLHANCNMTVHIQ